MEKAVIFDMDGVISDTQSVYSQIYSEVLLKYGIVVTAEQYTFQYAGTRSDDIFRDLFNQYNLSDFLVDALNEKDILTKNAFSKKVVPIKGVKKLIKKLSEQNRQLAVATGSARSKAELVLGKLDLMIYFPIIITADDVDLTKPSPEIYLKTAAHLKRPPQECVVIEDSRNGMLAASLAGMKCLGIISHDSTASDYPADIVFNSVAEISISDLN